MIIWRFVAMIKSIQELYSEIPIKWSTEGKVLWNIKSRFTKDMLHKITSRKYSSSYKAVCIQLWHKSFFIYVGKETVLYINKYNYIISNIRSISKIINNIWKQWKKCSEESAPVQRQKSLQLCGNDCQQRGNVNIDCCFDHDCAKWN